MSSVNTNLHALFAQHAMSVNDRTLKRSMTELSTGLRVSSAADDAAGFAIGNRMQSRILSLNQAARNANDGIGMMQTADGAAASVGDLLDRMTELAVQAASGTYGDADRATLNQEFTELKSGMESIIKSTTWNGIKVLDGSLTSPVKLQVGISGQTTDNVEVAFGNLSNLAALGSSGVATDADARNALTDLKTSREAVFSARTTWGGAMNRLTFAADSSASVSMNLSGSRSQLVDADYAKATADLAKAQILQAAGTAMLSQANQQPVMVLHLLS